MGSCGGQRGVALPELEEDRRPPDETAASFREASIVGVTPFQTRSAEPRPRFVDANPVDNPPSDARH